MTFHRASYEPERRHLDERGHAHLVEVEGEAETEEGPVDDGAGLFQAPPAIVDQLEEVPNCVYREKDKS